MVKTQAVNATEVAYVLNDFMGVHTGSRLPEILRLKGIININGIASISFAVIDKLTYKDPDDNSTQPLNSGEKQLLKMFIVYTHRLSDNDAIPEYWNKTTLDPKTFRKFQMSQEPHTRISCVYSNTDYKDAIAAATTTTTANPTGTHSIANHINVFNKNTTLLSEWMKHKRDSKTYPDLTSEDKNWDSWNRTVKALARNDQTSQVLDPVYVATSVDEKELFERQQTFMYVVFNCTVLTDVGKTIVRKHESTYDAQKVYSDLLDHHSKSTMAMIGKQDIFAEIVIMSINSWPASQTKFLLAWKDRLRIYKELNAGIDINDMQKTTLLQIAVQGAPSLARIKDDADILSTQLNKSLTFDEYYRLLESAAQQFDSLTERNTAGTRKAHRQTLRHDVFEHHTPLDSADDFSVLDMSYYDAMRTSQQQHQRTTPPADQRPCVRLADDQWKDLEDKARTLWKSISAPNKAIILRYSTMQHPDAQTTQQVHFITSQCLEPDTAEFMVSRCFLPPRRAPLPQGRPLQGKRRYLGCLHHDWLRQSHQPQDWRPPQNAVQPTRQDTYRPHRQPNYRRSPLVVTSLVLSSLTTTSCASKPATPMSCTAYHVSLTSTPALTWSIAAPMVALPAAICALSSGTPHGPLTSKGMTNTAPPTYLSLPGRLVKP
jgi:hypothetical protein